MIAFLKQFLICFMLLALTTYPSLCEVVQLDKQNIGTILNSHQLVFVNFYADWCRFSRMLAPIFEEGSNIIHKEFTEPGVVTFGKVDCDSQPDVAQQYHVNKYPTMKLFRNGQLAKREFRGQRSADALANFVREQLKDPITEFKSLDVIYELPRDKRTIVGYFTDKESREYSVFQNVAKSLKDDCQFYVGFGEASKAERTTGDNIIYKPIGETNPEMVYLGSLGNEDLLRAWAQDKCVPLVREITFSNGEELTEEGLPFLILFHKKEDTESLEKYTKEVSRLISFKSSVNFLFADCETFSHPLHHLGKSVKDCPLIAIDSFKHMYLFPSFGDVNEPGKLKQFILDLHSGKLHREFHHGPDPVVTTGAPSPPPSKVSGYHIKLPDEVLTAIEAEKAQKQEKFKHTTIIPSTVQPSANVNDEVGNEGASEEEEATTIKSIFVQMKPSEHRYTLLKDRDEL